MSIRGTKQELVQVLKAKSSSEILDESFFGLEFASGKITPKMIFIGLKGENRHGQEFLSDALTRGAALAIVEDEALLSGPFGDRCLQVADSYQALAKLAEWWRAQLPTRFLAITGSVGKTTTKELSGALLSRVGRGAFAKKSFNNHIGVPYTICQVDPLDLWAVTEIGTNHPGEIEPLVKLVKPHVAVVTAIGPAHVEYFGDVEAITKEKLSIRMGLSEGGTLVLNGDSPELMTALPDLKKEKVTLVTFGEGERADLRISDVSVNGAKGSEFTCSFRGESVRASLPLLGKASIQNAGAALLGVKMLFPNLSLRELSETLSQIPAPEMRLNLEILPDGRRVLNDSYNANPTSMRAALETLPLIALPNDTICCVVGDMRELGDQAAKYHLEIGRLIKAIPQVVEVIAVGENAHLYGSGLEGSSVRFHHFPSAAAAREAVRNSRATLYLIKASRGIALEKVIDALKT